MNYFMQSTYFGDGNKNGVYRKYIHAKWKEVTPHRSSF